MIEAALLRSLCQGALDCVETAAKAIMEVYGRAFTVVAKADHSPLTEADTAANQVLDAGLKMLTPRFPVLSEESPARMFEDRVRWARYWLVDPLDGTREFISKNGEFTVNVALIEHGVPVLGIIAAPAQNWVCYATAGGGAWFSAAGAGAMRIHSRSAVSPLAIGVSRSHYPAELTGMLAHLGAHQLQPLGSALKFVGVAKGELDLYPRLSSSSCEWDIAAGQCIVSEAGGAVLGTDGKPLRYNQRADLLVPAFVALGDTAEDWLTRLGWRDQAHG
jgi:3'(2'), 5'-bisphosphate nucleotidase